MNKAQWTKNCTRTFTRIDGGKTRVCGKEFTTTSFRLDWCDACMEAFIKTSLALSEAAAKYREEQRAAGRTKFAGQWTYDTTEKEATK